MAWFRRRSRPQPEARSTTVTQASANFLEAVGLKEWLQGRASDIVVTTERALGVPAIWAAVNFLSGTIAGLPLQVYRKTPEGRERVEGAIATLLHDAWNPQATSFSGRKYLMDRVLTGGRGFVFIERNGAGRPMNLWPLDPGRMKVVSEGGLLRYHYQRAEKDTVVYEASEVLDLPFMLKPDGVGHLGPIATCREAVALAIAATEYGAKYFNGGGVPPFVVTGNFQSPAAMQRAADDFKAAIDKASKENRLALTLPAGLEVKSIGGDPQKAQLVESRRFAVEEIARVYSLPPTFLQDLTHGTFANTEQQDLHFVKHTLKRWIEQIEQEMNLKLFGRTSRQYVEFNVDGLLRGDFKTRMEGHAIAIQNGLETPNEGRTLENRPPLPGGDRLMIQGATVPLVSQGATTEGGEQQEDSDR